jgi:hypothetical protein
MANKPQKWAKFYAFYNGMGSTTGYLMQVFAPLYMMLADRMNHQYFMCLNSYFFIDDEQLKICGTDRPGD